MKNNRLVIFLFFLASCSRIDSSVGISHLSEPEMIDALLEIHLLEAAFEIKITEEMRSGNFNLEDYYNGLFDSQSYSREEFKRSFSYYSRDPLTIQRLLDSVLMKIQMLELSE
tara:strand:- start:2122 stop:2460 length:339 start_codon:yes stop_codon:yes gene_type:complete